MKDLLMVVMIRKSLLIFLLWVGLISPLAGQETPVTAYRAATQSFRVQGQTGLFPFSRLDTTSFALLETGARTFPGFVETVFKYSGQVHRMTLSPTDPFGDPQVMLRDFDRLLVVVPALQALATKSQAGLQDFFTKVIDERAIVIILGAYPLEEGDIAEPFRKAAAVVQFADRDPGPSLAAQYVFGGWVPDPSIRPPRLGYVAPEVLGLDGRLLRDSIRDIVSEGLEAGAYPGAQVLVAYRGKVVYHETFGYHTYDSLQRVRPTDIYDLASVTKVSSALPALMKWYGEGRFDLDAPLEDYFPKFKRGNKDELTFRAMLAHHARLLPWIPYWKGTLRGNSKYPWRKRRWDNDRVNDYRFRRKTFARDSSPDYSIYIADDLWLHRDYRKQIYRGIRKSPLNEEPGYVYSGLLFYLLPEIVADQAGTDFERYLKQTFYQPLGASTITYNPLRFFPRDRIVPTERDTFFRMTQIHGYVHDEGAAMMGGVSGNAGLFSSANDLAKLFQMYMNMGSYGGEQVIAESALREFTRCQFCDEGNRRGLGFDKPLIEYDARSSSVAEQASPASFGHSGYTGTFAWADPESQLLFIFLSNRVYPTRLNRKLYELGIRPRIHQILYEAMDSKSN